MKYTLDYDKLTAEQKAAIRIELRNFLLIELGLLLVYIHLVPDMFTTDVEVRVSRFFLGLAMCFYAGWVLSTPVMIVRGWIDKRRRNRSS